MGPGLAVVVAGLVALLWSTGTGQAMLAVGMGVYLVGVVITVVGIILVYRAVPSPRLNFIQLRWYLLHDAVQTRSASAEQWAEGTGPFASADRRTWSTFATAPTGGWRSGESGCWARALRSSSLASSPLCGRRRLAK